jgi:hypothetical protein
LCAWNACTAACVSDPKKPVLSPGGRRFWAIRKVWRQVTGAPVDPSERFSVREQLGAAPVGEAVVDGAVVVTDAGIGTVLPPRAVSSASSWLTSARSDWISALFPLVVLVVLLVPALVFTPP